jgi:hypothetical protein
MQEIMQILMIHHRLLQLQLNEVHQHHHHLHNHCHLHRHLQLQGSQQINREHNFVLQK